jgi:hypothetical protein
MSARPELDAARAQVVHHGLTAAAVGQLTGVVSGLSLEGLGPVKQLLKRFFSEEPWTERDDDALADAIGEGSGAGGQHDLETGLALQWSWEEGRFRLRVVSDAADQPRAEPGPHGDAGTPGETDLGTTFDGPVVPEATPSPRTIRFATPALHGGPSRAYDSANDADDPRVARLFGSDDVTNVLVGPDFVAVTIARPARWEAVLGSMLRTVTEEFTDHDPAPRAEPQAPVARSSSAGSDDETDARAPRRLERAWSELGSLRAGQPTDLEQVVTASLDTEASRRQVAAALLADAPPDAAAPVWDRLLTDRSRAVRRSAVDAVASAAREELRPLLERALDDADAWTRWKALRGLDAIGAGPSRSAIEARGNDPDFRVRLEAARVQAG